MANLKKIDNDQYEYINSKGERHVLTKAQVIDFVRKGKEIFIDGKRVKVKPVEKPAEQTTPIIEPKKEEPKPVEEQPSSPQVASTVQSEQHQQESNQTSESIPAQPQPKVEQSTNVQQSPSQKVYNFETMDEINFAYKGNVYPRNQVTKNLLKKFNITVNNRPVKLNDSETDFVYADQQEQEESFKLNQININSILHATPPDSTTYIALAVTTDEQGNYIFKNEKTPKEAIINSLDYGKIVTLNGKLLELTEDKRDFRVVDVEKLNAILAAARKNHKTAIDLKYVDYNKFYYARKNTYLDRAQILKLLKKGINITVDGKPIAICFSGLDFDYLDKIDPTIPPEAKPIHEIKKELEKQGATLVTINKPLPSYFGSADDILTDFNTNKDDPQQNTKSFRKMKDLQSRLFQLSADSNMINVNTQKTHATFDFAKFVNYYEKMHKGLTDTFKNVLKGKLFIFDFKNPTKENEKVWKDILKFHSSVNDTYKEMGDDYLNIGYPCVSDVIYDTTVKPEVAIPINAPLFFIKTKLIIDPKTRQLNFIIDREKQQTLYKANKELLLYLTTKLNKNINLHKYKELFDDITHPLDSQLMALDKFFTELEVKFDIAKLKEIMLKHVYTEYVQVDNTQQANAQQNVPQQAGLQLTSNCFMGIFKTLNSEIFKDYDRILTTQEGKDYWTTLNSLVPNQLEYYKEKGQDFKEADMKQIVELDYSQKVACRLAIKNSINIVGPAGTGKSQTISNILGNFIANSSSTLFVAEKKTATDVVFKRLKNLRFYCLPLFDKENWNETLTKALKQTLKRVGSIYGSWDTLKLESNSKNVDSSSINLDSQFDKMIEFRDLMSSDEGFELQKLTIEFSESNKQEAYKDAEKWVPLWLKTCKTSKEFWKEIKKYKMMKPLYEGCSTLIDSITDKEIAGNPDKKNMFLKCCKYYDSPTILDNEMIKILQEKEFKPTPIDVDKPFDDIELVNSFKLTNQDYKVFVRNFLAKKQTHSKVMESIKEYEGFVTLDTIKGFEKQIKQEQEQLMMEYNNQMALNSVSMQNQFVPPNQSQFNQNPNNQFNPQNPQFAQNGSVMPQFNPNQMMNQQQVPGQYNQYQQFDQQVQNQFSQQQNQYAQQPQNQFGQQPTPAPVKPISIKSAIDKFAEKYDEKTFNFDEIKHYKQIKENFSQDNSRLNLDSSTWFNETCEILDTKLKTDLYLAELKFLKHVKTTIDNNVQYADQYNKLYGIVDNNDKLENVEEVLKTYGQIIYLLFPVVIASPNLVCKYLNAQSELFEHIVIDEASMLSLERAVPILFRGKKFCVVGDSKQLKPLTYLEQLKKLENYNELYDQGKIDEDELKKQQDLINEYSGVLDFISPKVQKTTLQYHYRAVKTELVKFSNVVFYDDEMIIADNYKDRKIYNDCGLIVKQVDGDYKDGINVKECQALYDTLLMFAKMNKYISRVEDKVSVGIIVFTSAQKDYLENLIANEADPDIQSMKMLLNQETGEDNSLFIKDVESVQGDERDVILMSLGSSSKNKVELIPSLGLLNTTLGPNFLNVMTTRARKSLMVFKSFKADDIPPTGNEAVKYYKDFIKYIDLLSDKTSDKSKSMINNLFKEYEMKSATIDYSNLNLSNKKKFLLTHIFKEFSKHIDRSNFILKADFKPISNQTFDLVAIRKSDNIPEFALIFDDFIKNIYKTTKQSEFYDYLFLKSRGWNFNKVTSKDWADRLEMKNSAEEIQKLIKKKLTFNNICYYVDQTIEDPNEQLVDESEKDQIKSYDEYKEIALKSKSQTIDNPTVLTQIKTSITPAKKSKTKTVKSKKTKKTKSKPLASKTIVEKTVKTTTISPISAKKTKKVKSLAPTKNKTTSKKNKKSKNN